MSSQTVRILSMAGFFIFGYPVGDTIAAKSTLPPEIVIGWNDLGMHCMNRTYQSFCVLPPYNNLNAQVVLRGNPPRLVTQGVTLNYSFTHNTTSANKINFWDHAQSLFKVTLAPNVGLAGKGLTGTLDYNAALGVFEAPGVPLTPFEDTAPTVESPYQLANVTLTSGQTLMDQTTFVAPVSVEMHCDQCHHASGGGTVEQAILALHDEEEGTNLSGNQPVLCANCHSSNALGTPGQPGLPSLSLAMHGFHAEERPNTDCYACHPGAQTQCLRDVMYSAGLRCKDCHGDLPAVALALQNGRKPWLEEPKCSSCHIAKYAEETGKLYRHSFGHGGLACEACHNSPHAILPTIQPKDSLQVMRLQNSGGPLGKCSVCHTKRPTAPGPHGLIAPPDPLAPPAILIY
jgi:hypothetical protein